MITLSMEVQTLKGKNLEFLRALEGYDSAPGLMKKIQAEINCIGCYYLIKHENKFSIKIELKKLEEVVELFRSECFSGLQGAIKVLCKSPEVKISNTSGIVSKDVLKMSKKFN